VSIIAGSVSSGVAVQMASFAEENQVLFISGPAATDAVTGLNEYTFRSGRQSYQDVAAAASLVQDIDGSNVVAFVQDSEFGAANIAALENVLGSQGATINEVAVPLSANEFTPFVQQVVEQDPDLVFVAWAGDTTPAMWEAMEQQGVLTDYPVTTGLGDVATWPLYGPAGPEIQFLSHYYSTAPDNEVNDFLLDNVAGSDLFTPDGFVAAQMIVQAVSEGDPDDVPSMIEALRGWTFEAPKGTTTIRASDHAMLQPMFTASMENMDSDPANIEVETLEVLDPDATAPPEAS
jgi:branched-chain amino acid transport system substrate-binding protein